MCPSTTCTLVRTLARRLYEYTTDTLAPSLCAAYSFPGMIKAKSSYTLSLARVRTQASVTVPLYAQVLHVTVP